MTTMMSDHGLTSHAEHSVRFVTYFNFNMTPLRIRLAPLTNKKFEQDFICFRPLDSIQIELLDWFH